MSNSYDPTNCSRPDSSVHGILQAKILEWFAISFSKGFSQPGNWTQVLCIAGRCFSDWAMQEAQEINLLSLLLGNSESQPARCCCFLNTAMFISTWVFGKLKFSLASFLVAEGDIDVCVCVCSVTFATAKSLQSCPTLCDPIDGSPPGSPVPGILQARTLERVAISSSNARKWKVKVKSLSRAPLLATPWTAAHQAPPSMGFSR